jgi:hypothetical protein
VNGPAFLYVQFLAGGQVQAVADHVEDVTFGDVTHRHGNRSAGVDYLGPAYQTVGGLQGDGTHDVVSQVLGDFEGHRGFLAAHAFEGHVQSVIHIRQLIRRELDIHNRADDPGNAAGSGDLLFSHCFSSFGGFLVSI